MKILLLLIPFLLFSGNISITTIGYYKPYKIICVEGYKYLIAYKKTQSGLELPIAITQMFKENRLVITCEN